jgi:hypothetical protein
VRSFAVVENEYSGFTFGLQLWVYLLLFGGGFVREDGDGGNRTWSGVTDMFMNSIIEVAAGCD